MLRGSGLRVTRRVASKGDEASISWSLRNTADLALQIGGLGFSMPFNQLFTGRHLANVAANCSFTEVYLGAGAGYVQVTRANGRGPVLLVLPSSQPRGAVAADGAPEAARDGAPEAARDGAPEAAGFEAWRPLRKDESRDSKGWMFEALYEIVFHSKAYAQEEWNYRGVKPDPWNIPTQATLLPGATATYGVRLRLAASVDHVPAALVGAGMPVATPLPAASLHVGMQARVEVLLPSLPSGSWLALVNISADPPSALDFVVEAPRLISCADMGSGDDALRVGCDGTTRESGHRLQVITLKLREAVGRCRLTLRYAKGCDHSAALGSPGWCRHTPSLVQTVHLIILEHARSLLQRHGAYGSRQAWLPAGKPDPWHRAPAFMGSDADRSGEGVGAGALLDEPRIFMDGLSDEAGAAAPLAMAIKQLGAPVASEVAQLEAYVHETLWTPEHGDRRQFLQGRDYAVRASMVYWSDEFQAAPERALAAAPALTAECLKCWTACAKKTNCCNWMVCWSENRSLETWRAYNYPHVTAVYWALYRLARHFSPPLASRASWHWYLLQAARTAAAMWVHGGKGSGTSQWGLMVGSVFERLLADLERELEAAERQPAADVWTVAKSAAGPKGTHAADSAQTANASELRAAVVQMRNLRGARMRKWMAMEFPYGSEFPWDSTGHEEIHTWLLREGHHAAANKTVDAVLAYMAVLPHWAYSGSARRYWDYVINGKTSLGNEREFHHYGSTLNAVAVLDAYRAYPGRGHLLRLGAAALLGHLSNIHPSGAASMAWHGDPSLLRRDAYSGDYGIGLYGYWRSAAAYLDCSVWRGWECMLCDIVGSPQADGAEEPGSVSDVCGGRVTIAPRDALRRRAYIARLGLTISVEGAVIEQLTFEGSTNTVKLALLRHEAAPSSEATLFLRSERVFPPAVSAGRMHVSCLGTSAAIGCARRGLLGSHVVRLSPGGSTSVSIAPHS